MDSDEVVTDPIVSLLSYSKMWATYGVKTSFFPTLRNCFKLEKENMRILLAPPQVPPPVCLIELNKDEVIRLRTLIGLASPMEERNGKFRSDILRALDEKGF